MEAGTIIELTGIQHHVINQIDVGDSVTVRREENEYGNNGIAFGAWHDQKLIGYIPEIDSLREYYNQESDEKKRADMHQKATATITARNQFRIDFDSNGREEWAGVVVKTLYNKSKTAKTGFVTPSEIEEEGYYLRKVYISLPCVDMDCAETAEMPSRKAVKQPLASKPKSGGVTLASFNEQGVEVEFFEDTHEYWHKGKRLTSVTRLKSSLFKPFDMEMVSAKCATAWGMAQDNIKTMWGNNGQATSMIGSGIHLLMENYIRFGERGLTKMPVLRDIVTSFPWKEYENDTLHAEVLITSVERGICGLCDLLKCSPDGVYQVEDYKVNHAPEQKSSPLKAGIELDLPKGKFGEYTVQLSVYSQMLEMSGLKVSDTVKIHTWNGAGKWGHHPLKRIRDIIEKIEGK